MRVCISGVLLFAAACGGSEDGRGSSYTIGGSLDGGSAMGGTDDGADGGDDGEDTPADDPGAEAGDDDDDDGEPKFDLPTPDGGGGPIQIMGCSKIDFLFVVDNSQSMEDDQANLVANFPTFIDGIEAALEDVEDFHVGVVTSDGYAYNSTGCNALGSLVTKTGGPGSSNATCGPYAEGRNYMTKADDLAARFECAARVGAGGWSAELPMNALEVAVRGDLAGPGGCNEGFLRDDALLVAVIITDEWDGPGDPEGSSSTGTPDSWYQTVIDAKVHPENAAVVALVNYLGGTCPPEEQLNNGQNIVDFTAKFGDNGFIAGVCDDYGPVFEAAIGLVDEACMEFIPPEG